MSRMTSKACSAERVSLANPRSRSRNACWIAKRFSASRTWPLLASNCALSFDMPPPRPSSEQNEGGNREFHTVVTNHRTLPHARYKIALRNPRPAPRAPRRSASERGGRFPGGTAGWRRARAACPGPPDLQDKRASLSVIDGPARSLQLPCAPARLVVGRGPCLSCSVF